MRERVDVATTGNTPFVVKREFHGFRDFYIRAAHNAAAIIRMNMSDMEMLKQLAKTRGKQLANERIEQFFQIMELDNRNPELRQNFIGRSKDDFVFRSLDIHLQKKVPFVTLQIFVFPGS